MKRFLHLLLLSLPISANAAGGTAAGFFTTDSVDSKDAPSLEEDGAGFAAAVNYVGGSNIGFYGDYATTRLEDSRTDLGILRAGTSYSYSVLPELLIAGKAEVVHVNAIGSDFGFGAHGEVSYSIANLGSAFLRGGFIEAGDLSGPEFSAGVSFAATSKLRVLVEYRVNTLESEAFDAEADVSSIRLGLGIAF